MTAMSPRAESAASMFVSLAAEGDWAVEKMGLLRQWVLDEEDDYVASRVLSGMADLPGSRASSPRLPGESAIVGAGWKPAIPGSRRSL